MSRCHKNIKFINSAGSYIICADLNIYKQTFYVRIYIYSERESEVNNIGKV